MNAGDPAQDVTRVPKICTAKVLSASRGLRNHMMPISCMTRLNEDGSCPNEDNHIVYAKVDRQFRRTH